MSANNVITYGLVTTVVGLEIHQSLTREDPAGRIADEVRGWIISTREEGIRKALIELGWTPPAADFIPAPRPQSVSPIPVAEKAVCRHIVTPLSMLNDPNVDAGCMICGHVRRTTPEGYAWGPM